MYSKSFWLTGNRGNNTFVFDQYTKEFGVPPRLFVPGIIEGDFADVKIGSEIGFRDVDEQGVIQECLGLQNLVRTEWRGVPVVLVDNHNHVFYFWYEALVQGLIREGAVLVHVDQHKDTREPVASLTSRDLQAVFEYTNYDLNVGNYILPALKDGLLGEIQLVTGEAGLTDWSMLGEDNKILNLDLDFFAAELDYIDFELAKNFILKQAATAQLITIATSPYFIEQDRSKEYLLRLLD